MQTIYDQLEIPEARKPTSLQPEQAAFIYDFLKLHPPTRSLETGLGFGCSAVHILMASQAPHIAIDPYQGGYDNLGLRNIVKLGLQARFQHISLPSHIALPQLVADGVTLDFVLIDGGHKYDEIFLDHFYCSQLLNIGGYVLFDDSWLDATRLVIAYLRTNRPDFREITPAPPGMFLFQKIGKDLSEWNAFRPFSLADV